MLYLILRMITKMKKEDVNNEFEDLIQELKNANYHFEILTYPINRKSISLRGLADSIVKLWQEKSKRRLTIVFSIESDICKA